MADLLRVITSHSTVANTAARCAAAAMSGMGYTMVNDGSGKHVTVMLNGTQAQFQAPRTKSAPAVEYAITAVRRCLRAALGRGW